MIVGESNTTPNCGITAPMNGETFVVGESIIFQATASDAEITSENLTISWSSDKDGDLGAGVINSSGDVTLSYSELVSSKELRTIQ